MDAEKPHKAKGFCNNHYRMFLKYGDPLYKKVKYNECKIEGCERPFHAKGLCKMHHKRYKKHGDPTTLKHESHNMRYSPEYRVWQGMKDRCFNYKSTFYYRYGGRGITVCERWKNSFISFYEDMGERPFDGYDLDRIDNDGDYEPDNCRWISHLENCRNSTQTKLRKVDAQDIKNNKNNYSVKYLSLLYGVSENAIYSIKNGRTWGDS